jgi:signal transduction histidine kinase
MAPTLKPAQKLVLACDVRSTTIHSDTRILRNILFNLVSNASKYSGDTKTIFLSCSDTPSHTAFSVRDEGIGIPKEDQKHMFERFFRASNAGQVQGTGLGLNIIKRYVELLNGSIDFTSEYGEGSTFTFHIPLS